MRYASICSGIEAASAAWQPLGWEAAWFAEIEAFPSAVLAHHYPDVPNLGDITSDTFTDRARALGPIDVLIGGTPCQSFSVAGLRGGLSDDRGNLAIRWCQLIMDLRPDVAVWENVPGVLSDKSNAFGAILAGMVGADAAFVSPRGTWTSAGLATGPEGRVAWRVLDAQHFGVPQRRRRVFAIRCPRDGADPAEILLVEQGVLGHFAARGAAGQDVAASPAGGAGGGIAGTVTARKGKNGGMSNDDLDAGHMVVYGGNNTSGPIDVATACQAHGGPHGRQDFASETFIAHTLNTQCGQTVRRLTPVECERLQGFPDNWTKIPWKKKPAAACPDGPRYRAIGNSMAMPVIRWIGRQIAAAPPAGQKEAPHE